MKTYVSPQGRPQTETVVAVGSFDGVHLGHQALLGQLKAKAREYRVPSVVYTFDPPTKVLTKGAQFLSSLPEKADLLALCGIDEMVAVPFTPEFAARSKAEFLEDLRLLRPRAVVVGEDFYFGRARAGSAEDLHEICADVVRVPINGASGEDFKSSTVREYLQAGEVRAAARLLGRPYAAQGVVIRGDQLGRTIGYPTANIRVPEGKMLPPGVHAMRVQDDKGREWGGMGYVGRRPVVNGNEQRLEVNLFDFSGDLYGQELQVQFIEYLRGDQNFAGLEELREQLARDEAAARAMLG